MLPLFQGGFTAHAGPPRGAMEIVYNSSWSTISTEHSEMVPLVFVQYIIIRTMVM